MVCLDAAIRAKTSILVTNWQILSTWSLCCVTAAG